MSDDLVDVYDFTSKEIRRAHIGDLPSHFIRARIVGIENACFVDPNQLKLGPYQNPPFDSCRRSVIQRLIDDLAEVYPMTFQEWEDGFRRDRNPDKEMNLWLDVVDAYLSATATARSLEAKKEIFAILAGCICSTPEHILASRKLNALTKSEAESLIASFANRPRLRRLPSPQSPTGSIEALKIVLLAICAAIVFGILHDQITVRVCVEYFTIGHPPVFQTESPTLLGFGWGIIATWWFGLVIGIPMACSARLGARPAIAARDLVKPIGILLVCMACLSLIAGISGYIAARAGWVWLLEPMSYRVPTEQHFAFIADLWSHLTAYGSGFMGGVVLCFWIWRRRNVNANREQGTSKE